jgi:hypothetical protein
VSGRAANGLGADITVDDRHSSCDLFVVRRENVAR